MRDGRRGRGGGSRTERREGWRGRGRYGRRKGGREVIMGDLFSICVMHIGHVTRFLCNRHISHHLALPPSLPPSVSLSSPPSHITTTTASTLTSLREPRRKILTKHKPPRIPRVSLLPRKGSEGEGLSPYSISWDGAGAWEHLKST